MFKEEETTLKNNMSARRRDILSVKKLNLLKSLLDDAGHGDISLVDDLSTSFDLTGALPESHSFARSLIFLWRAQKGSTPLQGEHTWNHQIIWRSWIGINCIQPPWKKLKRGSLKDPWTWNLCLKEPFWRGGSGWSKKPRLILLIIINHPSWTVVREQRSRSVPPEGSSVWVSGLSYARPFFEFPWFCGNLGRSFWTSFGRRFLLRYGHGILSSHWLGDFLIFQDSRIETVCRQTLVLRHDM